jgi:uncharacterized phage-like protein YoqJ
MYINPLACCFAGHREMKLPYKYGTEKFHQLKKTLRIEIGDLMRQGVVHWFAGCQNGIDNLSAMIALELAEEISSTAYLHLIQPYEGMEKDFNPRQKREFEMIKAKATSFRVLHRVKTSDCFRERNQQMVDKSHFLLAVLDKRHMASGTTMTINMAKRKSIEIRIIDPQTLEVERIPARIPPKLLVI